MNIINYSNIELTVKKQAVCIPESVPTSHKIPSHHLSRYASTSTHCDLLITMQFSNDDVENKTSVMWLVQQMREHEPNLRIEVRYHRLNSCYAIYLTADYKT